MSARQAAAEQAGKEALRAIGTLFEPGDVIEIRALDVGRNAERAGSTHAGYFSFERGDAMAAALRSVDGRSEGVYVVLNRLNPDLLARSSNRLRVRPKNTTTDADIIEWRWLYIDADANRPAGISATDAQHEAASERIRQIRDFLTARGWPEPIWADSGNGGHLLYRLPAMDVKRAGDLVKRCLKALAARYSDPVVKVDESTATPARLCKLYGTMARKGDSTPERPHRRSALIETPERIDPVPITALEALASEAVVALPKAPKLEPLNRREFDIEQWLANSGLEIIKGPESYDGGRRWTFRECPFNPEHKKSVVIELSGGALVHKCLHKSCSQNGWKALRQMVEPDYRPDNLVSNGGSTAIPEDDFPLITDLSEIPSVFSLESQIDWAVDGMIAKGSITLICAESGTGKTWLGYYLAGCVARGTPVFGHAVHGCQVLYLDGENPLYVVKQRLVDLGIAETPNLTIWGGWNTSPPVGPESPLVIEFARRGGLIIYDSLIEFHPGSEQSSTETRAFMRKFRRLTHLGATVIILHHTGKAETAKLYRGSSDIKAAVDTAYLLTRDSEDPVELGELSMNCFKARLAPGRHFGMKFEKGLGFVSCESFKSSRTTTEVITKILKINPCINQTAITELGRAQGCSKRQIENCLRAGKWVRSRGPKNSTLYSLPDEGSGDDDVCS